jgi:mycofactocin glycosyltransferase
VSAWWPNSPDTPRLVLDDETRVLAGGGLLVGGNPPRALRLSPAGQATLAELRAGRASGAGPAALARRLIDAGLAHPSPRAIAASAVADAVTVVVPVRDRPLELDRCLAALDEPVAVVVVDDGSSRAAAHAIAAVCRRRGVRLVRAQRSEGPAAARNRALDSIGTELVAFLDSDTVPPPGWLARLIAHFEDPSVGAVAPRVTPLPRSRPGSTAARYLSARSPLDMGPAPARVVPAGRVAYVPAAALVVRRTALGAGFDPALRFGEDVDLIWRLDHAGWQVRYDPRVVIFHQEPSAWPELLRRRWQYGTSAAPLAVRHGERPAALRARPLPAAAALLALAGRGQLSLVIAAVHTARVLRRNHGNGVPAVRLLEWGGEDVVRAARGLSRIGPWSAAPLVATLAPLGRRRRGVAVTLGLAPLCEWALRRPGLDPLRWTAAWLADELAYGSGVWLGCWRARTLAPLRPDVRALTGGR